jgi:DNA replication protein DnaC
LESNDKEIYPEEIISIPLLSTKEQEEVLQECSVEIEGMLDLEQIFSHLYHHNLLSDSECEMLQASNVELSRKKKIARFITNLPRKGSNALDRFIQCLVNSADGTGHEELAQNICNTVKERSSLSSEESEQSTSKPSRKIPVYNKSLTLIIVAIILCSLVYINWSTITYRFNLIHSKSLPYPSENFVGREREMEELSKLIDFEKKDVRTVNIYGSPGFGKSTLATHFGHKMVKEGVTVHHVNMNDLPDKDIKTAVAEKILEGSIVSKNITFERLLRWARERSSNILVILDNCDDALHKKKEEFHQIVERVVEESLNIKILLTSRKVAAFLMYFRYFKVEQLSTAASCHLLERKVPSQTKLTHEEKEQIANLTGNVPLALQIIGSLLHLPDSPSPAVLIDELKNELITTLSPEDFPAHDQVFTSINVSYKYLPKELQQIGRQLTVFPGSFGLPAAFAVHVCNSTTEPTKEFGNQFTSLVRNSLLEHSQLQHTNRYQYHRLIKEYFRFREGNGQTKRQIFFPLFIYTMLQSSCQSPVLLSTIIRNL